MTGPTLRPAVEGMTDLNRREVGAVAPLLLALLLFGFYPVPMLDVINPFVDDVLSEVGASNDQPTVPAGAADEGARE